MFFAGSGLKHLQKDVLKKQYFLVPSNEILMKFNMIIKKNWKKLTNNYLENQKLASLRDWLLPMLMNGQITFKK